MKNNKPAPRERGAGKQATFATAMLRLSSVTGLVAVGVYFGIVWAAELSELEAGAVISLSCLVYQAGLYLGRWMGTRDLR